MPECRFEDGEPAVARYAMSDGCVCFPNDRVQDLCSQHEHRASPLGNMMLLIDYVKEEQ